MAKKPPVKRPHDGETDRGEASPQPREPWPKGDPTLGAMPSIVPRPLSSDPAPFSASEHAATKQPQAPRSKEPPRDAEPPGLGRIAPAAEPTATSPVELKSWMRLELPPSRLTAKPSPPRPQSVPSISFANRLQEPTPASASTGFQGRVEKARSTAAKRVVTEVPPVTSPDVEEVEFFESQPGLSYTRILVDKKEHRYQYEVIEPALSEPEDEAYKFVRDTLIRTLDPRALEGDAARQSSRLLEAVDRVIRDHSVRIDEVARQRLRYFVLRDFLGYGRIDVLMRDPLIEDISCDGPRIPMYVFHRQYESTKTNVTFPSEEELDGFVIRLAQRSGKAISLAQPLLDATLPDTSRLQASLAREVTTRGSTFTIRKFRSDPLTPSDLIRLGTISPQMGAFFWLAVEAGTSLLLAGGTASGKTSTLNAICSFIPQDKKIVSIEDTREINLPHENWIAGLTRAGLPGEGSGGAAIDMYKLLESALRQRPEYLLVGEVRGPEANTLFQAIATGHATYSTLHADSAMSAVYRLENAPIRLPRIMLQTLGGFVIQVQARIKDRLVRRIKEVVEIIGIDPSTGELLTNTVFMWNAQDDRHEFTGKSQILENIIQRRGGNIDEIERDWADRTLVLDWMVSQGIRRISEVARIINEYRSRPREVLERAQASLAASPVPGGTPGGT